MRCKNDRLILYVNWGVTLDGQKQVKVKFDDNDVIEQKWTSASDKTALFQPRPKQMFQQMMAAKNWNLRLSLLKMCLYLHSFHSEVYRWPAIRCGKIVTQSLDRMKAVDARQCHPCIVCRYGDII